MPGGADQVGCPVTIEIERRELAHRDAGTQHVEQIELEERVAVAARDDGGTVARAEVGDSVAIEIHERAGDPQALPGVLTFQAPGTHPVRIIQINQV